MAALYCPLLPPRQSINDLKKKKKNLKANKKRWLKEKASAAALITHRDLRLHFASFLRMLSLSGLKVFFHNSFPTFLEGKSSLSWRISAGEPPAD